MLKKNRCHLTVIDPAVTITMMIITTFTLSIIMFTGEMMSDAEIHNGVSLKDCQKFGQDKSTLLLFLKYSPTSPTAGDCSVSTPQDPPDTTFRGLCRFPGNCTSDSKNASRCAIEQVNLVTGTPGPCFPNPCRNTGVCSEDGNGGYKCVCPYPMGGLICAELACTQCWRKEKLVVFTNISVPMSWSEAYDYCHNQGLEMFLDKSWKTHGFIFGVLSNLITDRDVRTAFWIGMNRTNSDQPFQYVDGTVLTNDSFTVWTPGRPSDDNCINVGNTESFMFRWDDDDCDGESGWTYYPLCQGTYDFLEHGISAIVGQKA